MSASTRRVPGLTVVAYVFAVLGGVILSLAIVRAGTRASWNSTDVNLCWDFQLALRGVQGNESNKLRPPTEDELSATIRRLGWHLPEFRLLGKIPESCGLSRLAFYGDDRHGTTESEWFVCKFHPDPVRTQALAGLLLRNTSFLSSPPTWVHPAVVSKRRNQTLLLIASLQVLLSFYLLVESEQEA